MCAWGRFSTVMLVTLLVLSGCMPVMPVMPVDSLDANPAAAVAPVPVAHTPRFDAPPYAQRGPYAVGVLDALIADADGLPVSVWYPAQVSDAATGTLYALDYDHPNFPDFVVAGWAVRDAPPDAAGGPYPLVVYSHGLTLYRLASTYLVEHLASWGFVVIAGDHTDNWSALMGEAQRGSFALRPQEVTRQIDYAVQLGEAGGALAGMVDGEKVAVTGHSFGAETALLMGGARLNTAWFLDDWCARTPIDGLGDCQTIPLLLDKFAADAGLATVPDDVWPDWSDPRVDAVVPLAPGPQFFGPAGLAALQVPVLLFESELDWYAGAANAAYAPYTLLPDVHKAHVVLERGDHNMYLNGCAAAPGLVEIGLVSFCTDSVWDTNRAHDLMNHFTTAFLLAELKGDATAAAALAPEQAGFPGIQYATTAFGTQ